MNAADLKERITMPELLKHYGIPHSSKRISCPLHNGKDKNFSFNDHFYRCFVCGKSGDVISFAMEYNNLTFRQAMLEISNILHSAEDPNEDQRKIKREALKTKLSKMKQQLSEMIEQKHKAEDIIETQKPTDPDVYPSEEFLNALGNIGWLRVKIACLHEEMKELEVKLGE